MTSETALAALECSSESHGDPTTALREAVDALWAIAAEAAREGAFASDRVELMQRGKRILSVIIRRGLASGAFRPRCRPWAERGLAHALMAGVCARWVFGLSRERSLRAGPAVDAALEVLRGAAQ